METRLRIFRFNPEVDTIPYYRTYAFPWTDGLTLLAALRMIYATQDPTLGFRNYFCGRGLCNGAG